jgi:hypothetical protein
MRTDPEEVPSGGRCRVAPLDGAAEEQPERRTQRAEVRFGREGQVDLQIAGQEEDAVDRRGNGEIEQVRGPEVTSQVPGPVGQHLVHARAARNAEGEVQVRPSIPVSPGESADLGAGGDAIVRARQLEQEVACAIALLDGEHAPIMARPAGSRPARSSVRADLRQRPSARATSAPARC